MKIILLRVTPHHDMSGGGCYLAPEVKQSGNKWKIIWDANLLKNYALFQHQDLRLVWDSSINSSWQSSIFPSRLWYISLYSASFAWTRQSQIQMSYFALTGFPSWRSQNFLSTSIYVSLIGSGEGRHTTHLLKCVLLLSTSQTDWTIFWRSFWHIFWHSFWHIFRYSFWHLSDISFDILSDILSDISFDILSDISSDILFDIFLTYLLTFFLTYLLTFFLIYLLPFFLTYLLTFFLTYLLTLFLTYLLTYFLTYLLTFFLTYQNQNLTSTASQKKQLFKFYIYLSPCNKSNIHDNFVPVKYHRPHCIGPPRQKAIKSKDAKRL